MHGIDPDDLMERDYSSFARGGQDPEIQTLKYQLYCETREKLYTLASKERAKLAAKAKSDAAYDGSSADSVSVTSRTSTATSVGMQRGISTMMEKEKRRLEKAATRQQKELMRLLNFESKSKDVM